MSTTQGTAKRQFVSTWLTNRTPIAPDCWASSEQKDAENFPAQNFCHAASPALGYEPHRPQEAVAIRPRVRFTQVDLRRALRAAKAEGFDRIEIDLVKGKITISRLGKAEPANPLDEWMAKRARATERR